jgi:leucyl-tRNA synthetase
VTSSAACCINSGALDGFGTKPATSRVAELATCRAGLGEKKTTWRLRDWGIVAPALLGHADPDHPLRTECGVVPVPEKPICRWCCRKT